MLNLPIIFVVRFRSINNNWCHQNWKYMFDNFFKNFTILKILFIYQLSPRIPLKFWISYLMLCQHINIIFKTVNSLLQVCIILEVKPCTSYDLAFLSNHLIWEKMQGCWKLTLSIRKRNIDKVSIKSGSKSPKIYPT